MQIVLTCAGNYGIIKPWQRLALRLSVRRMVPRRHYMPCGHGIRYGFCELSDPHGASQLNICGRKAAEILQSQLAGETPITSYVGSVCYFGGPPAFSITGGTP